MLSSARQVLGYGLAALSVLAMQGCGTRVAADGGSSPVPAPAVALPADGATTRCADVATSKDLGGSLVLMTAVAATGATVDGWLAARAERGGPVDSLSAFSDLRAVAALDSVVVCLFKTKPRPIPVPPGVATVADGMTVIVDSSGAYQVDGMGSLASLQSQVEELAAG